MHRTRIRTLALAFVVLLVSATPALAAGDYEVVSDILPLPAARYEMGHDMEWDVDPMLAVSSFESVSGMVQNVDLERGALTIVIDEFETRQMIASRAFLEGLEPGHEIQVELVDGIVMAIHTAEVEL